MRSNVKSVFSIATVCRWVTIACIWLARMEGACAQPAGGYLYEQEPFDVLVLTSEAGGGEFRVYPLDRRAGSSRGFRVRLLSDPDREYDIAGSDIARVRRFEDLVLEAGKELLASDRDAAYRHFEAARALNPQLPGLRAAMVRLLRLEIRDAFKGGQFTAALAFLTELKRLAPDDNLLARGIPSVVQRLFDEQLAAGDFTSGRRFVDWAANNPELATWLPQAKKALEELGSQYVEQANQTLQDGDHRKAQALIARALEADPNSADAITLRRSIAARHPNIIVGVTRQAHPDRLGSRHDWASRRARRLMGRDLVEVLDYGPDGAVYHCPYGALTIQPDSQGLQLQVAPTARGAANSVDGYDVAKVLLSCSPSDATLPLRTALIESVRVDQVFQVDIALTRPLLQPAALLTLPMSVGQGVFRLVSNSEQSVEFEKISPGPGVGPESFELTERKFNSLSEMMSAFRDRKVQAIDRLTPLLAEQAAKRQGAIVGQYRFPSQHFLIPNEQKPLMSQRNVRRAICYAIAREAIVTQDLLGGRRFPGCGPLTGPFTLGRDADDAVGYASDDQVTLRPYDPSLALALYAAAQRALVGPELESGEAAAEDTAWQPLTMVHPDDLIMAGMANTVARYLAAAGIECEVVALKPGTERPEGDWDLWYADVTLVEPLTDINWLVGEQGMARGMSPYLQDALDELPVVTRWTEARELLRKIHRLVSDELVLIPLWQLTDHFVVDGRIEGVPESPVALYQDVEKWRLK